jgi:hypothetical protein
MAVQKLMRSVDGALLVRLRGAIGEQATADDHIESVLRLLAHVPGRVSPIAPVTPPHLTESRRTS